MLHTSDLGIPKTLVKYRQAKEDPDWTRAMDDEIQALENKETWKLVERHLEFNILTVKWIYKHKLDEHEKICQ